MFEDTAVPVLQIPQEEYRRFQVSVAQVNADLGAASPLGRWLVDRYARLPPFVRLAGTLAFGDSPLVTATAFDAAATPSTVQPVRRLLDDGRRGDAVPGRTVRMAHGIDPCLNYADLVALLRASGQKAPT